MAFFTIAIVKQPHNKRISLHLHPVLHLLRCVTSGQQSCFSDFRPMRSVYSPSLTILGLSTIAISDSILAKDTYFGLFKGMQLLCTLISTHLSLILPGWITLMNLGARRQKSQVSRPCFGPCQLFFVKCMRATCIIISGLKHGKLDTRWE